MSTDRPVLITGGAGFIGSHFVERLLADGHPVVVIDDLSTGSLENLAAVRAHPALRVLQSRVSACAELPELVANAASVVHLAAAVGVERVLESTLRAIETNLHETEVVLRAARRNRTPVLIASSSEVYGKSEKDLFSEDDDLLIGPPTTARWSYACSKLMDEFLALAYSREHGVPVILARIFNTVGPRQTGRYGMVLPRFINDALADRPLRVFGDGRQTRCFCDVADTVESLLRLQRAAGATGQIVNVGTSQEISIRDLASLVVATLNSRSEITFVPFAEAYPPGFEDLHRRRPDTRRLVELTGYQPSCPLSEVILRTAGRQKKAPSHEGAC